MKSPSSVQTCTSQGTFGWVVGYMVDERVVVSSRYDNESETNETEFVQHSKEKYLVQCHGRGLANDEEEEEEHA